FESFSIKNIQTSKVGPDPKVSVTVVAKTYDDIVTDTVRIEGIMKILSERIICPIIIDQTSAIGTDPQISFLVFCECVDVIERQTGMVDRTVSEKRESDNIFVIVTYSAL